MDHLLQETKRIRPLTNQVAYNTFIAHESGQCTLPTGPKVIKYNYFLKILQVFVVVKVMTSASRTEYSCRENKFRNHVKKITPP